MKIVRLRKQRVTQASQSHSPSLGCMAWDQKIQIKRRPRMPQGGHRVPTDHQTWKIFLMHQICNCIQHALHVVTMTDPQ